MWSSLSKFSKKYREYLPLGFLVLGIVSITLPAIFSTKHYLYNLEPYPDGLWYALSGKNLFITGEFAFYSVDTAVKLPVPNLYPALVGFTYLLIGNTIAFFILNLILIAATCTLLYLLVLESTRSVLAAASAAIVYFSHTVMIWLTALPMTENLAIFLFTAFFYLSFKSKLTIKQLILAFLVLIGLSLTRYSLVPSVIVGTFILLPKAYKAFPVHLRKAVALSVVIMSALSVAILFQTGQPYLSYLSRALNEIWQGSPYFGFKFFLPNLLGYTKLLMGFKTNFLWENVAFTTAPILILSFLGIVLTLEQKKYYSRVILLLMSFSTLVAPLIFYVQDARYSSLLAVSISIGAAWFIQKIAEYPKDKRKYLYFLVFLCLIGQLYSQKNLIQKIIAANLLHRSVAWQFEAISSFNIFFKNKESSYLITSLPPFLVYEYGNETYKILPLSKEQEFFNKKQQAWGSLVPQTDLPSFFKQLLKEKNEVYISNAYITHSHKVIADYQDLEKLFIFTPVSEGCLQTCTIYKLQLKE